MKDATRHITERLSAVRRRIRRLQCLRGVLAIITISLLVLILIMAADYFLAPLPSTARWGLFVVLCLTLFLSTWNFLLRPLSRKLGLIQIARWLEIRHPQMEERISTAMELSERENQSISQSLLDELIAAAEADASKVNPQTEVRSRRTRRWLTPALGALALLIALFVIWPQQTGRLLVRAIAPFSQLGNAGAVSLSINPGDIEVLEDQPVSIEVIYYGDADSTLVLESIRPDGAVTEETLHITGEKDGGHLATYTLPSAQRDFQYRVRAGRALSDTYQVTVWPKPRLTGIKARYTFPEYTGWADSERDLDALGTRALIGTQINLTGQLNTAVEDAQFTIEGNPQGRVITENSANGSRVKMSYTVSQETSGQAVLTLRHRLSDGSLKAIEFPIKALPDDPPAISLTAPVKRTLTVRPDDQLPLDYVVTEEIGMQAMQLIVELDGKHQDPIPLTLPLRDKRSKQFLWHGHSVLSIASLLENKPRTRIVKLKLRAIDNRPPSFDGPGMGESEVITLKISRGAESVVRQELRAQNSDVRESTEKARRDLERAAQKIDSKREDIAKEKTNEHDREQLEKAREELAKAEETLRDLAERMKNSVHAQKAPQAKKAADKAQQAREKLENAPLQDGEQNRREEMKKASEQAREAAKQLDELRRDIERDQQKIEDLARLDDLARKERELARQAQKKAEQAAQEKQDAAEQKKPDEAWKNQQREVQRNLQNELQKRPEALAEAQRQQAEKARGLAKKAQQQADQQKQLKELAEKQNQGAEKQQAQALQKQIAQAQKDLLGDAQKQLDQARERGDQRADELPEAIAQAQQAAKKMAQQDGQKDPEKGAGDDAQKAAEQFKKLAQQADAKQPDKGENPQNNPQDQEPQANPQQADAQQAQPENAQQAEANDALKNLSEQQEKIAEAQNALENGDNDQALKALQELQANEAKQLAEELQQQPQINPAQAAQRQANQQAKQAQNQAQQAAEQADQQQAKHHQQAAQNLEQAAKALDQQAQQLDTAAKQNQAKAQQAGQQKAQQNQAPADPQQLAEAFQKSAEAAAAPNQAQAAAKSAEAADALEQLAQQAMQNMKSGQQPGKPGQKPGEQPGQSDGQPNPEQQQAGNNPDDQLRPAQADPGVPPELAKLGVSAKDWEKLKTMMRAEATGTQSNNIPRDYQELVRKYFQEISKE